MELWTNLKRNKVPEYPPYQPVKREADCMEQDMEELEEGEEEEEELERETVKGGKVKVKWHNKNTKFSTGHFSENGSVKFSVVQCGVGGEKCGAVECSIKDCEMTDKGCVYCKYTVGEDAGVQVASWGGETVAQIIEPDVPTNTVMLSAHTGKVFSNVIARNITGT